MDTDICHYCYSCLGRIRPIDLVEVIQKLFRPVSIVICVSARYISNFTTDLFPPSTDL